MWYNNNLNLSLVNKKYLDILKIFGIVHIFYDKNTIDSAGFK